MTRRVPGEHVVLGEDVARALGAGEPVVALDVKNSRVLGSDPTQREKFTSAGV
jgi:hypothetical protein